MPILQRLLTEAREELPGLVDTVLEHQLEHAALYYVFHNKAAAYYAVQGRKAYIAGRRVRQRWFEIRAMWHRVRRRRFEKLVQAKDLAGQCQGVLSCLKG